MKDVISREAAVNAVHNVPKGNWSNARYAHELQAIPAADVVPVVRCKDCKYYEIDLFITMSGVPIIPAHHVCTFWAGGCMTNPDGYCFAGVKKDKRTEYCPWCKEPTSYRIKEREYVLTRDRLTFGYYGLKAFCEKCEGRMIVPWIAHENLMRLRDAYENARAKATESDGGER